MDNDSNIADKLGIVNVTSVRESDKYNIAKIKTKSGYKSRQILIIAQQNKENDHQYRKAWADKIIENLNNDVNWKYGNTFQILEIW